MYCKMYIAGRVYSSYSCIYGTGQKSELGAAWDAIERNGSECSHLNLNPQPQPPLSAYSCQTFPILLDMDIRAKCTNTVHTHGPPQINWRHRHGIWVQYALRIVPTIHSSLCKLMTENVFGERTKWIQYMISRRVSTSTNTSVLYV